MATFARAQLGRTPALSETPMPIDRSSRLEDLIAALRATNETSIAHLAEELGVSKRTIRRDIATLRLRGMDIEGDRGRGG